MVEMTPVTREEKYLAKAGGQDIDVPTPVLRVEMFLSKIAGEDVALPTPVTRLELFLAALAGEDVDLPTPTTRLERFLAKAAGDDIEVPTPITRIEQYLMGIEGDQPVLLTYTGNLPATLTAVAHALYSLTRYGLCEQRNLPSGYTELTYLQSNGSQLLQLGITRKSGKAYAMEVDIEASVFGSTSNGMFSLGTDYAGYCVVSRKWGDNNMVMMSGSVESSGIVYNGRAKYTVSAAADGLACTLTDGTNTASYTRTAANYGTKPMLFGLNASYKGSVKIYSAKLWEDATLKFDLVPCKNADNVCGMFNKVDGTFIAPSTGALIAGDVATPTPSAPMDIYCNNGKLVYGRTGKNFINTATCTQNSYINQTTGVIEDNSNYIVTAPLYLANGTYTYSQDRSGSGATNDRINIATYNADDTPIQVVYTSVKQETVTVTLSGSYAYVRICYRKTNTDIMLEAGETATAYEPYTAGVYPVGTPEALTVNGQNLVDLTAVTNGYYYTAQGAYTALSSARLTDYVPIKAGQKYTVFIEPAATATSQTINVRCNIFNSEKSWQSQSVIALSAGGGAAVGVVTATEDGYIRVSANKDGAAMADWSTFQIVHGEYTVSTMPAYQPYVTPQTATVPMLLGVGDYKDEAELIEGIKTGRVGVMVLTGTEGWTVAGTQGETSYRFSIPITGVDSDDSASAICTHIDRIIRSNIVAQSNRPCIRFDTSATSLFWYEADNNTTLAQFTTWLAEQYANGTPVMVFYPLSTETTDSTTPQHLVTHKGVNIVDSVANVSPVEVEIEYYGTEEEGNRSTPMLGMRSMPTDEPVEPVEETEENPTETETETTEDETGGTDTHEEESALAEDAEIINEDTPEESGEEEPIAPEEPVEEEGEMR